MKVINKAFNVEFCKNREKLQNSVSMKKSIKALKAMYKSSKRPVEFGIVLAYSFGLPGLTKLRLKCIKSISSFNTNSTILEQEVFKISLLFSDIEKLCGPYDNEMYDRNWTKSLDGIHSTIITGFINEIKICDIDNYKKVIDCYASSFSKQIILDLAGSRGITATGFSDLFNTHTSSNRPLI